MAKTLSDLDFYWEGQEFRVCMTANVTLDVGKGKTYTFEKGKRYWANFKSFGWGGGWDMDKVTIECPRTYTYDGVMHNFSLDLDLDDDILYIVKNSRFRQHGLVW